MAQMPDPIRSFLELKTLAVVGASRRQTQPGCLVYRKLKQAGYQVFPVNPAAEQIDGDPCFTDLASLPDRPEGVVITTPPQVTPKIIDDCIAQGIRHVWIHRSIGQGSLEAESVARGRSAGLKIIDAGCPMMYVDPVDTPHRIMRFLLRLFGRV